MAIHSKLGFEHRDHHPRLFKRALHLLPCHDLLLRFLPRGVQILCAPVITVDHNNWNPPSRTMAQRGFGALLSALDNQFYATRPPTWVGVLIIMTWLLAFVTTFAALRSAWYWYKSSQIYAVPDWVEVGRDEPKDPLQVQLGWMNAQMKASGELAILNRWGAIWTAGTVMLGAATTLANIWSS